MPLKMIEPTKHSKSGRYRIRLTIPKHLRASARSLYKVGVEFTANLETGDYKAALARAPAALSKLQAKLKLVEAFAQGNLKVLTQRQLWALAGEWYREAVRSNEDKPGSWEGWDGYQDTLMSAMTHPDGSPEDGQVPIYEPDQQALQEARTLLSLRGIVAHEESEVALAVALWSVRTHYADLMKRRAAGDYGSDKYARTLPTMPVGLTGSLPRIAEPGAEVSFEDITRGWARDANHDPDAKPTPRAYYDRHRTAARLSDFLGHNVVSKVTKADAVRWKESMVGKSLATVANDVSEMSAIWKFAIRHGKATENPFAGILPPKKARNRKATRRPFTDAEAGAILAAARLESGALRWLPWVLAATGARLSEVCQGTKADLVVREGVSFLRIHADDEARAAGEAQRSVKNEGSERMVPVHPVLEAEGFLMYVARLPSGSALFPDIAPDHLFGQRGTSAQKLVSRWLRGKLKVTDRKISPAHSWRHWFVDKARAAGLHPEIRNAITGHADDGNESHRYGHGWKAMPAALAEAIGKIEFPTIIDAIRTS